MDISVENLNVDIGAYRVKGGVTLLPIYCTSSLAIRGTQREYSSKQLKHSIVERTLVFKR